MPNWITQLNADPTPWLLDPTNPPVRYLTLRDLFDKSEENSEVQEAKVAIREYSGIQKILTKQNPEGYWGVANDFYMRSKYKGTVWSMILLAEMHADGTDPRIHQACDFLLRVSQDRKSGGFSVMGDAKQGGRSNMIIPCLTGNMVWVMLRFGQEKDPRVQQGIDWITTYQRFDDGLKTPLKEWPYRYANCWGKHTCFMGAVKALKALAEIPVDQHTAAIQKTIQHGSEYLLQHHIFKQSHDLTQISKPEWLKFGYPRMWDTDLIEICNILIRLGIHDARMKEAVDVIRSKQQSDGRWLQTQSFNGRFLHKFDADSLNKWVTLNALKVIKKIPS